MIRLLPHFGLLLAGFMAAVAVACSGTDEPTVPIEETSTASPTQTPRAASTPAQTPRAAPTPAAGYDSTENMFRLFSGWDHNSFDTQEAIALAIFHKDKSMVPVMIETLRFFFGDDDIIDELNWGLSAITGQELRGGYRAWDEWMEWLGSNADEYHPPDGYVRWKSEIMSLIDPRFAEFLAPAEQGSRINVFEIAWGGVRPDGIPDLQNAPVVSANEQDYLLPADRVFGVSINGEHRAYPLRIVNAHEMANDVLGGEPIALAY